METLEGEEVPSNYRRIQLFQGEVGCAPLLRLRVVTEEDPKRRSLLIIIRVTKRRPHLVSKAKHNYCWSTGIGCKNDIIYLIRTRVDGRDQGEGSGKRALLFWDKRLHVTCDNNGDSN